MPKEPPPSSQDDNAERNRAGTLIEPLVPNPIHLSNVKLVVQQGSAARNVTVSMFVLLLVRISRTVAMLLVAFLLRRMSPDSWWTRLHCPSACINTEHWHSLTMLPQVCYTYNLLPVIPRVCIYNVMYSICGRM